MAPDDRDPTREELEQAWARIHEAGVSLISNMSVSELGRIVAGSPHYSDAERRMAGALLIQRAELIELSQRRAQSN